MTWDVLVIGAGVSGLATARELARRGRSVLVLEARERIGGRVHTVPGPDATPIELGAQVIHGDDNPVAGLFAPDELVDLADPDRSLTWRGAPEPIDRGSASPFRVTARLRALERVMGSFAEHMTTSRALEMAGCAEQAHEFCAWVEQLTGTDVSEASLRQVLHDPAWTTAPGRKQQPRNGMADVAHRLCGAGVVIRLASPVCALEVGRCGVEAQVGGQVESARGAVLTVPPAVVTAGTLSLQGLARSKSRLAAALPSAPGRVDAHLSREPAHDSGFAFVPDAGLLTWQRNSRVVTLVAKGRPATAPHGPSGRTEQLEALCGLELRQYASHDWTHDPYAGGAFTTATAGSEDAARWATPVGALAVAGEACGAGPSHPYLDRALRSTTRAVQHLTDLTSKELTYR